MIESAKEAENGKGFTDKIASTYDEMLTRLSQAHADFQVQSPIAETSPLRAKIGLKEGLQIDDRFYVMEQVLRSDGKSTKDVRRAVFRVTKDIADNRKNADGHGKEYTTFYQVGGGSYDKGMTLVSKKDLGLSYIPLISNNFVGSEIESRISKEVNIPGTFVYARLGLPMGSMGTSEATFGPVEYSGSTLFQFGLGLRKEFNFARMFNASAHVGFSGYGYSTGGGDDSFKTLAAYTLNVGGRFGVQVAPALNFFVGAEYGATFGDEADYFSGWEVSPISASFGARISF